MIFIEGFEDRFIFQENSFFFRSAFCNKDSVKTIFQSRFHNDPIQIDVSLFEPNYIKVWWKIYSAFFLCQVEEMLAWGNHIGI